MHRGVAFTETAQLQPVQNDYAQSLHFSFIEALYAQSFSVQISLLSFYDRDPNLSLSITQI